MVDNDEDRIAFSTDHVLAGPLYPRSRVSRPAVVFHNRGIANLHDLYTEEYRCKKLCRRQVVPALEEMVQLYLRACLQQA